MTTDLIRRIYENLAKGDVKAALAECDDKITFQVPGRSALAGKYTKADYSAFLGRRVELSGGSHRLEVHDVMASDRHATVLASDHLTRDGQPRQLRTVHVWRIENGKPVAWYEYPRDLYQFDEAWAYK